MLSTTYCLCVSVGPSSGEKYTMKELTQIPSLSPTSRRNLVSEESSTSAYLLLFAVSLCGNDDGPGN